MTVQRRYTSADLDMLPEIEGIRYEIIDGELFVAKQPSWDHQSTCGEICAALKQWSRETGLGRAAEAPGMVFADDTDDDVIPDVVWISRARLARALDAAGHLTIAPELVVEVLSPGSTNERRDREAKLGLYSRRGVDEYWIVDWRRHRVEVFRRVGGPDLELVATLGDEDALTSPLLPGFEVKVASLWEPA
jgi:Uma2 family endonuclease